MRFLLFYGALFAVLLFALGPIASFLRDPANWRLEWIHVRQYARAAGLAGASLAFGFVALLWPLSEWNYRRWVRRGRPMPSEDRKRIASAAQWLCLGLLFGSGLGAYLHHRGQARLERFLYTMGTATTCTSYAELQYRNASFALAKRALLEAVKCQERLREPGGPEVDPYLAITQVGLIYARLAMLEAAHGDPEESARYLLLARQELVASGWRDTSDENIFAALRRIDKWVPEAATDRR